MQLKGTKKLHAQFRSCGVRSRAVGHSQMAADGRCRTYGTADDFKLSSATLGPLEARLAEIDNRFEARVRHEFH